MRDDSAPIRYGPFARLSDWYQGWRDGVAGVPVPRRGIATTAHREVLIRRTQDSFERERLEFEARRADKLERIAAIQVRLGHAVDAVTAARAALAELDGPPSPAELERRRPGEEHRTTAVVRLRRLREHARAVRTAEQLVESRDRAANAVASELAAAVEAAEREAVVAGVRVRRVHEHAHRRLSAYRRRLVRSHPEGDWVNVAMDSRAPAIPGWAVTGFDETELMDLDTLDEPEELGDWRLPQPEPELVAIGAVTTIGSEQQRRPAGDAHVVLAGYGIAAHHATLTRRGAGFRLQDHGRGGGTYRAGRQVGRVDLEVGDTFEIGEYELLIRGVDELEVRFLGQHELVVLGLTARGKHNKKLLTDMTFTQRPRTLMAVLGPSGAGKSTLFSALLGELPLDSGERYLQGHDLRTHPGVIRNSIGFVPQSDGTMHQRLTVRQLLRFSDRLRSPRDRRRGRAERIRKVCVELGLDMLLDNSVASLSGGERKRVSIALEVLAEPNLLMLDEPTSGLDAAKDQEVMRLLRAYARKGKSVITITHNTEHLDLADDVLVVVSRGRPVHLGPPGTVLTDLGAGDGGYTALMASLQKDPELAVLAYQRSRTFQNAKNAAESLREEQQAKPPRNARRPRLLPALLRQLPVLVHRQFVLVTRAPFHDVQGGKDWTKAVGAVLMPVFVAVLGALLTGLVVGDDPWGATPGGPPTTTAQTALSLLVTLTMLGGQALTYSDIVSEYPVIHREHRTGVLPVAVVLSKWVVFAALAVVQGILVAATFTMATSSPQHALVVSPRVELAVDLTATGVTAMSAGLFISVVAKRLEQAVTLATAAAIAQVALSGGLTSLDGDRFQQALAWLLPARWGFSTSAASVDLTAISPGVASDALWHHHTGQWTVNMVMLGTLTLGYTAAAVFLLRRSLRKYRR
ncbi:ATP-binding cassette domain-containing protein [Actinophytocola sp.]|uniref:ATP-binding cassette domain-containing protein n=1 Tax=Actinophytocola sp. TaxID=1872138 RepID=UPI002ED3CED6